ncbi:VRR-NUC domain-containing protein [Janthinobacterium sp. CG3]|uniref:VRR-NUC domain-containing protein n=2 Tax=unclassified Janthinobacterium TaxID=2610881 RepID=UPI000349A726|nr:VRR-NUC domain-containing protein [Janthinobacterium sp. CG3]
MPVPLIIIALGEIALQAGVWAWRGYRAYDTAQTALEAVEMAKSIAQSKELIKHKIRGVIESMSQEIEVKCSTFALVDPGGKSTVSRRGNENFEWKEYIERKIPFRPAISIVCKLALEAPIKVPRRIRKKIGGEIPEGTIEVTLKQTTASLMFETIDLMLDWKSPLKAEPNYNRATQKGYLGTPPTRPHRISSVFPFWPRPRGSLAPDLVIPEYRQKPWEIDNVFAAVEIKFPNDWVQTKQMEDYVELMTPKLGLDARKIGKARIALLRVPEDCTDVVPGEKQEKKVKKNRANRL